jgi:hypothetical protein
MKQVKWCQNVKCKQDLGRWWISHSLQLLKFQNHKVIYITLLEGEWQLAASTSTTAFVALSLEWMSIHNYMDHSWKYVLPHCFFNCYLCFQFYGVITDSLVLGTRAEALCALRYCHEISQT